MRGVYTSILRLLFVCELIDKCAFVRPGNDGYGCIIVNGIDIKTI